jgi:hypothetical protein
MHPYQRELLTAALESREKEVIEYQVNIDNYRLAIEHIGDDEELVDFKNQLEELLRSSLVEQKKSNVILTVMKQQLATPD